MAWQGDTQHWKMFGQTIKDGRRPPAERFMTANYTRGGEEAPWPHEMRGPKLHNGRKENAIKMAPLGGGV